MGHGLGPRGSLGRGSARSWPRRAADLDQGLWILLVAGILVLVAGVLGLFLGLDGAATAAALIAGTALTGLGAVLFSVAAPRYVGTRTMLAETLFDYTDAKARLAALDLAEPLREPFRRMARGEAAQALLEVVLRDEEAAQAGDEGSNGDGGRPSPTPLTSSAVDAERIAATAVDKARAALSRASNAARDRGALVGGDTLDQPAPPAVP